jgi:hypothetical protein
MATKVKLKNVQCAYPHVLKPKRDVFNGDETLRYKMMVLINKNDKEQVKVLKDAIAAEMKNLSTTKKAKNPLKDGDNEDDIPSTVAVGSAPYKGHYFINPWSNDRPGLVDRNLDPITERSEFQSGDWANITVSFSDFDRTTSRGVSCYLGNIQFVKRGDPIGNSSRPEDDFEAMEPEEDEDFSEDSGSEDSAY